MAICCAPRRRGPGAVRGDDVHPGRHGDGRRPAAGLWPAPGGEAPPEVGHHARDLARRSARTAPARARPRGGRGEGPQEPCRTSIEPGALAPTNRHTNDTAISRRPMHPPDSSRRSADASGKRRAPPTTNTPYRSAHNRVLTCSRTGGPDTARRALPARSPPAARRGSRGGAGTRGSPKGGPDAPGGARPSVVLRLARGQLVVDPLALRADRVLLRVAVRGPTPCRRGHGPGHRSRCSQRSCSSPRSGRTARGHRPRGRVRGGRRSREGSWCSTGLPPPARRAQVHCAHWLVGFAHSRDSSLLRRRRSARPGGRHPARAGRRATCPHDRPRRRGRLAGAGDTAGAGVSRPFRRAADRRDRRYGDAPRRGTREPGPPGAHATSRHGAAAHRPGRASVQVGSSGKVATKASSFRCRRSTARQRLSGSEWKVSPGSASTRYQAPSGSRPRADRGTTRRTPRRCASE